MSSEEDTLPPQEEETTNEEEEEPTQKTPPPPPPTLKERIKEHYKSCYNYAKYPQDKPPKGKLSSGDALYVNEVPNLTIIDIDIKKELAEEQRTEIRNELVKKLKTNDIVVMTAHGGLHIYTNTDDFIPTSNRMVGCYKSEAFNVDIFSAKDPDKKNIVMMANSKVQEGGHHKGNPILLYSFINGSYDDIVERSAIDVLNDLKIKINVLTEEEDYREILKNENPKETTNDIFEHYRWHSNQDMPEELIIAIVEGFNCLEIHNDAKPIKEEITLLPLFAALNSLPEEYIEDAYKYIDENAELTTKAGANWIFAKKRYSGQLSSPYVLVKMLKIHNESYYNDVVKPLMKKEVKLQEFDFKDEFIMNNFRAKINNGEYDDDKGGDNYKLISDLAKVIRYIEGKAYYYIEKIWDTDLIYDTVKYFNQDDEENEDFTEIKVCKIHYVKPETMEKTLKKLYVKRDKKRFSVWDILYKQRLSDKITLKAVAFISKDPQVFSIFQGYRYKILDQYDENIINNFLVFVKEVISAGDEDFYEYLLSWFAFIIQYPGQKTETSLVLRGEQGIGKNVFTNVLCNLLSGYSVANITDINEITGQFNSIIEYKMLIVCNELKNTGETKAKYTEKLKSLQTEKKQIVGEKFEPNREVQNVSNFIFCSNNINPVKIEGVGDRRYFVQEAKPIHKGDFVFFKNLTASFTPTFYENLLTFFIQRDIKGFEPRNLPITKARKTMEALSADPITEAIKEKYDDYITVGIKATELASTCPEGIMKKVWKERIKSEFTLETRNGGNYYVLTDMETRKKYKPDPDLLNSVDTFEDYQLDQKIKKISDEALKKQKAVEDEALREIEKLKKEAEEKKKQEEEKKKQEEEKKKQEEEDDDEEIKALKAKIKILEEKKNKKKEELKAKLRALEEEDNEE